MSTILQRVITYEISMEELNKKRMGHSTTSSFIYLKYQGKLRDSEGPCTTPTAPKSMEKFFNQLHPVDWRFDGFGRSRKSLPAAVSSNSVLPTFEDTSPGHKRHCQDMAINQEGESVQWIASTRCYEHIVQSFWIHRNVSSI